MSRPQLPSYEEKQKVYALLNGTFHAAIILEVAKDSTTDDFLYYVRYVEHDSRLDQWVRAGELKERLQGRTHHSSAKAAQTAGGITTRRQSVTTESKPAEPLQALPKMNEAYGGSVVSAKGSGTQSHAAPTTAMSKVRARRDSAFFSRTKNIFSIFMGPYEVETWYFSPYHLARAEVQQRLRAASQSVSGSTELQLVPGAAAVPRQWSIATRGFSLHICPFCLQPFYDDATVVRHLQLECLRYPPGNEVYRDPVRRLVVLELDGSLEPTFCEHLALLSKLFLEHKALDHDMTPFLFYVLCSVESHGLEVLGYFSKEKQTPEPYNLSCILVLPQFQSRGIGRFLIELSYELSRREGKVGTPEKPLSDLGEKLYLSYWSDVVTTALARAVEEGHRVSMDYLVQATSMVQSDIQRTLQHLQLLSGGQLSISPEVVDRCTLRQLRRERDTRNYTFFSHLLSWAPGMYVELRGSVPVPMYMALTSDGAVEKLASLP